MGMFDDIKCLYPLPLEGANDLDYQTKDTEHQFLDKYEIRADGTLWHQDYDIEDHSEYGKWKQDNPGKEPPTEIDNLLSMAGCLARVNERWEQVIFNGEICFYTTLPPNHSGWIEWSSYFVNGMLNQIHLIEHRLPTTNQSNI